MAPSTKHPYEHMAFMAPVWQEELDKRNDQVCGICRFPYDPALFPQGNSSDNSRSKGYYVLRDQVLSQNIKSKEKTNNFERRDAKEKDLTFTELSKVLADSEPLCKGRPVSLQCGHNFGATCILDAMRWMKYESHREPLRCPYCRKLMTIHQNIIPAYEAIYEKAAKQSRVASAIALRLRPSMILEMGRNMLLPYTRYRLSGGRGSVRNLSTMYGKYWYDLASTYYLPTFKDPTSKSRLGCGLFHHRRSVRVDGKKLRTDPKEAFELLWHDFMGLAQSAITNEQQQEFARFLKVVLGRAIDEDNWDRGVMHSIPPGHSL